MGAAPRDTRDMWRQGVATMVLALMLAAPASAAQPAGGLRQLRGRHGCVLQMKTKSCARARALDIPSALAISADGHNLYATAEYSNSVAVFARHRGGWLTQLTGRSACVSEGGRHGCAVGRGLGHPVGENGPRDVAVSADGRYVYVASEGDGGGSLATFARNPTSGQLSQLSGSAGCLSGIRYDNCAAARAMDRPNTLLTAMIALTADGHNLYLTTGLAVDVFDRDPVTGVVTQSADATGCLAEAIAGCTAAHDVSDPLVIRATADAQNIYVTSQFDGAVSAFARDSENGRLMQLGAPFGCLSSVRRPGCGFAPAVGDVGSLAISPHGDTLYAGASNAASVAVVARDPATGRIAPLPGRSGCVSGVRRQIGCTASRITAPEAEEVSRDGRNVYITDADGLEIFQRFPSGRLRQLRGRAACVRADGPPCARGRAMTDAGLAADVIVSPDDLYVYTAFDGIAVLRRSATE